MVTHKPNDRNKDIERWKEESHMKSETEIGVTLPQAKERQQPPEAGKSKGRFMSGVFRGIMAPLTL